ncbi:hypothetical protein D3C80_2215060 [compost metagenome]
MRTVAGEVEQVVVDRRVQHRFVVEAQGIDIHQRALLALAARLQVFPGVALGG